jgi:predicted DNA-binding transcriptional regulator YafY
MSKISNVLLMLQYLENGRKYSIQELSEKLEVTPRMIRSYKDELLKCGIYIDTVMGPYGGYVLNQSIMIPPRRFNKDDYEFLNSLKVSDNDKEKLENIKSIIKSYEYNNENIELKDDLKNTYNILNRAIKEKRKVKINYYSFSHGNIDRVIRPLDMFLYNSGWGVAAFCELRQDLRHFELKRINKIELLKENF